MALAILDVTNVETVFYEANGAVPPIYFDNDIVKESVFYINSVPNGSFLTSYFTFPQADIEEFLDRQDLNSNQKIVYTYLYLLTELNLLNVKLIGNTVYPTQWFFLFNINNYNPTNLDLTRPLYKLTTANLLPDIDQILTVEYHTTEEVSLSGNIQPEIRDMLKVFSKNKLEYNPSDDIYLIKQPTISELTKANIAIAVGSPDDLAFVPGAVIRLEINGTDFYILLRNNQTDYDYKITKLLPLLETIQSQFNVVYFKWELWSYALVPNSGDFNDLAKGNIEFTGTTEDIYINCLFPEIEPYLLSKFGSLETTVINWNSNKGFLDDLRLLYNYETNQKEIVSPDAALMYVDPAQLEWWTFFIDNGQPSMMYMTIENVLDTTTSYRDLSYVYGGIEPINNAALKTQYDKDDHTDAFGTLNALNYVGDVEDPIAFHKHIWGLDYNISDYNNSYSVAGTFDYDSDPIGVKKIFSNHIMKDTYPNTTCGHATNNALVNQNGTKYTIVNMTSKYYKLPIPMIKELLVTENIGDATTVLDAYFTMDSSATFPEDAQSQDFFDYIYIFFNDTYNTVNPELYVSTKKAEEQIKGINQYQIVSTLINADTTDSIRLEYMKDHFTDITNAPFDIFTGITSVDETSNIDADKSFFLGANVYKSLLDTTRAACFMINWNDLTTSTILNETFRVNLKTMQFCKGEKLVNAYNIQSIIGRKDKYLYVFFDGTRLVSPLITSDLVFSEAIYLEEGQNAFYFSDIVQRVVSFELSDYDELISRYRRPGLQDHSLNIHYVNNIHNSSYIFNPFYNDIIMVK